MVAEKTVVIGLACPECMSIYIQHIHSRSSSGCERAMQDQGHANNAARNATQNVAAAAADSSTSSSNSSRRSSSGSRQSVSD